MKRLALFALLLLACGAPKGTKVEAPKETPKTEVKTMPYLHITVKDFGDIVIKLYPEDAPKNVENIIALAKDGKYNGLTFHRIIKGFVIQGGDPNGDGTGNLGATFNDEISKNRKHLKGTLALANAGHNTNGSQFYICLQPLPGLDAQNLYTIIGETVEGIDVVDKIGLVKTNQSDMPLKPVVMEKVWIEDRPIQ
jgi:cyclophilin family peptidyl-prolyl cis-trans isomerase